MVLIVVLVRSLACQNIYLTDGVEQCCFCCFITKVCSKALFFLEYLLLCYFDWIYILFGYLVGLLVVLQHLDAFENYISS